MGLMKEFKKNEIYTVTIDGYTSDAMGVCHIEDRAVFVPNTIINEVWKIKLVKVSATAIYARAEELIQASPARRDVCCPHFGKCGGCSCLHMDYDEELRFKLEKVNSALRRIGKQTVAAEKIYGSENRFFYRNKAIFAVDSVEDKASYGFYKQRSHELISIDKCFLQSELSCRVAKSVTDFMNEHNIPCYNEQNGKGVVRHVFCRQAQNAQGVVACIVAARGFGSNTEKLVDKLRYDCPELSGIVLNVNKSRGNTVLSGDFYTLWGNENIIDTLCSLKFEIAPQAFFQINPPQAERLYELAMDYALSDNPKLAFDLYCGAGTISLRLARDCEKVIACEIVPEAIENAKFNAEYNGLSNAEFICADASEAAQELLDRGLKPDVVLVDPPRKGMDEQAVKAVASMEPDRIVYVSCDCATLARDILRFSELGYTLTCVSAVDMFPCTPHIESVALLCKK